MVQERHGQFDSQHVSFAMAHSCQTTWSKHYSTSLGRVTGSLPHLSGSFPNMTFVARLQAK